MLALYNLYNDAKRSRVKSPSLSGAHLRAARALLGISAQELAALSEVSWGTIQRYETLQEIPETRTGTLAKLRSALEAQGVEFIGEPETPGVQLRRKRRR